MAPPILTGATGSGSLVCGKNIAIIPFPAVGDNTIYLRLAQTLTNAGACVSFYSDLLASAADMLPWLNTKALSPTNLDEICAAHDLVIADVLTKQVAAWTRLAECPASIDNLLATTAKHLPDDFVAPLIPSLFPKMRAASTPLHRALCPERSRGPSMVEWVDRYALETFGLTPVETPPLLMPPESWLSDADTDRRILVFPTTPNPSKNFSLKGFTKLVDKLEANGWLADVVCMPDEKPQIAAIFGQSRTHTFPSLRELILHMMQSRAVISNDSGGGHLGSMLGLTTYTITKKTEDFVWRPGFNRNNRVISPVMTFKWITGRVWRPFIPLHRILNSLGKPPANRLTLETPLYKGHLPMRETITIQTPNGKQILAFKGDSITRQIQKHGEYDKNALDSIREVLSIIKPITSLDIGANIGNHSLVIAGLSERLFAFEPVDFVHAVLQQNLLNNGARNAVAVNIGLSLNAASKTIFVPKTHNVGCSSLEERGMHADRYDIRLIEGDTYVADNDIHDVDFIKIDIEGHEGEAIEGLRATILKNQPLVLMEWDQRTAGQFVDRHLFESLFAGYSAFSISQTDNKKIHPKTAHGRLRRLWFRLACKRWCLSKFDPRNGYRNVFLVPDRYLSAFSKFRYLADS